MSEVRAYRLLSELMNNDIFVVVDWGYSSRTERTVGVVAALVEQKNKIGNGKCRRFT